MSGANSAKRLERLESMFSTVPYEEDAHCRTVLSESCRNEEKSGLATTALHSETRTIAMALQNPRSSTSQCNKTWRTESLPGPPRQPAATHASCASFAFSNF